MIPSSSTASLLTSQMLLFDADDTLWENNIYFERAIADFIGCLDHQVHTPAEVREHLNRCERATIAEHGYGLASFRRSLIDCFEQLTQSPVTPERHQQIVDFTRAISETDMELLPGIAETLTALSRGHRIFLVTKGNVDEQTDKLERSGLRPLFTAVEVLAEKNTAAYVDLIARHELSPANTWMIGNSPRSDINPALGAGLNAVFIPHDATWVLEHETLDAAPAGQTLLQVSTVTELMAYFASASPASLPS